ncbi:MAG: ComF family protein [Candidatus Buchananbacteria bacterium]|nr:ComF family protein [Candidatus Buchananbacteria bacterium]
MKLFGSKLKKIFLDIIFPIKCLSCRAEGDWLCLRCLSQLRLYNYNLCPICGLENKDGQVCGYCRHISNLDGLLVILENNKLSQKMIHLVKYNFIPDIFNHLKPRFVEYFGKNPLWRDFFVLTPVPLHPRRFLERGFNQSQLICDIISGIGGNKINDQLLKKIKYNRHQVGLGASKRHVNITGSFKTTVNLQADYNKPIVIVDDVYTTGSTLEECAKKLKEAGYKTVWGLVLIRS